MLEETLNNKRRYTEAQIFAILRRAEDGMPVAELCLKQRVLLQMAGEIWRDGCLADEPDERDRR